MDGVKQADGIVGYDVELYGILKSYCALVSFLHMLFDVVFKKPSLDQIIVSMQSFKFSRT